MKTKLCIGCGSNKPGKNWIGLDHVDTEDCDVVHDLSSGELPFEDNCFEVVEARHILEHFNDETLLQILEEVHRVCQDGALFYVVAPHYLSWNSATLDHKQLFSRRSFNVVDPSHSFPNKFPNLFHVLNWEYDFYQSQYVQRMREKLGDEAVAAHVPNSVNEIIFELRVLK